MNIAIMGIRGIPANYGGFETFAEQMAPRLVERGHQVTVYGRSNIIDHKDKYYKGVRLVILPTISHKYLDTVAHTFLCSLHALKERYDAILYCNSANAYSSWIPRVVGTPTAINVDGLEWQRGKWNVLGQWFYKISEWLSTWMASEVITDARGIEKYYLKKIKKVSTFIPYGSPTGRVETTEVLERFNLKPRDYVLYVSRLEPENNAHLVVKAFEEVNTDKKCVIVGDAPYNAEYIAELKKTQDPRIIFTGYVFGQGYRELQSNAYFYVQATEVGGTHPALLEGMGHGNCVLANDVPEHREVLGETGAFFTTDNNGDLTAQMQKLLDNPDEVRMLGDRAMDRIKEQYSWEKVTDDYENLFKKLSKS
jgi:glycosyltransferase involved in cell wall biosynthesis